MRLNLSLICSLLLFLGFSSSCSKETKQQTPTTKSGATISSDATGNTNSGDATPAQTFEDILAEARSELAKGNVDKANIILDKIGKTSEELANEIAERKRVSADFLKALGEETAARKAADDALELKIADLQSQIVKIRADIDNINATLEAHAKAIFDLDAKIEKAKQDLSVALEEAKSELQAQLDALQVALGEELAARTNAVNDLSSKIADESDARTQLEAAVNARLTSVEERLSAAEAKVEQLQKDVAAIQERINTIDRNIIELQIQLTAFVDKTDAGFIEANNKLALEISARAVAEGELKDALNAEIEARKSADSDIMAQMTAMKTELEGKISETNKAVATLDAKLAEHEVISSQTMEALKQEFQRQLAEYNSELGNLNARLADANTAIDNLSQLSQDLEHQLLKTAIEQEHKFAVAIMDLSLKNQEMIVNLQMQIDTLGDNVEKNFVALEGKIDDINDRLKKAEDDIIAQGNAIEDLDNRLDVLEFFKERVQFCAGASANVAEFSKQIVLMASRNSRLFGAATDAPYGYGNMFNKYSRFKLAESTFDRYHYHNFLLEIAKVQVAELQKACSVLIAFPDQPKDGAAPIFMGESKIEVNGQTTVINWTMQNETEILKYFRIVLSNEDKLALSVDKIMTDYKGVLATGTQMDKTAWNRHVKMLITLVAEGTKVTKELLAFLDKQVSNDTLNKIMTDEGKVNIVAGTPKDLPLCRFGDGSVADRKNEAGLRYSAKEDGSIDFNPVNFHLPQQHYYFHDKTANKIYIARYEYNIAMGKSINIAYNAFNTVSSLTGGLNQILEAQAFAKFAKFPVVKERNVYTTLNPRWMDVDQACGYWNIYGSYSFRNAWFKQRARIPFEVRTGCWAEPMNESYNVCSQFLANKEDGTEIKNDVLKHPFGLINAASPFSMEPSVRYAQKPHPTVTGAIVFRPVTVNEANNKYKGLEDKQVCLDNGRAPTEFIGKDIPTWGNSFDNNQYFKDGSYEFYRGKIDNKLSMAVQWCTGCMAFGYNKPVWFNEVKTNADGSTSQVLTQKNIYLTFTANLLAETPDKRINRCVIDEAKCAQVCKMNRKEEDKVTYGENEYLRTSSTGLFTGKPYSYDYYSMLAEDKCICK